MPKQILRRCISCKKESDRQGLIRILEDHKSHEQIINPTNKQFGRSTYICKSQACIDRLKKHKKFKTKLDFTRLEAELTK